MFVSQPYSIISKSRSVCIYLCMYMHIYIYVCMYVYVVVPLRAPRATPPAGVWGVGVGLGF